MASFQMLPFTFLLLTVLRDVQAEGDCLSCPKHKIVELGKDINITCKNNSPIEKMEMTFCPLKGNNCSTSDVIWEQNRRLTVGETTLKIQKTNFFLNINKVKISHEGKYILKYITEGCMDDLLILLEVFAPYTHPQVMKRNDTVVCTASGGYPEEKLFWVSKAGINLAHNSTFEAVKNEAGSFNLSNILQLESVLSEIEYCCTFNHTRVPNRQPASTCITFGSVIPSMIISEETTLSKTEKTFIGIPFILMPILLAVILCRKKKTCSAEYMNLPLHYIHQKFILFSSNSSTYQEEFPL